MKGKNIKLRMGQVDLHYLTGGSGNLNLIFLHGWCINSSYWETQFELLEDKFTIYAPDLPGFGKSKAPTRKEWTIEEYALDIQDFIRTLHLDNVILVGHSMAGDIMIEVAIGSNSEEIIALVGIDNLQSVGDALTPEEIAQILKLFDEMKANYSGTVMEYADNFLFQPSTSNEVRERVKQDLVNADENVSINALSNFMEHYNHLDSRLPLIGQKLYLIVSDANPVNIINLEKLVKNGVHVEFIESTGHYPMIEKPDRFNDILEEVLCKIHTDFDNKMTARTEISIDASVRRVWDTITDPELINRHAPGLKVDANWREGAEIIWSGYWNGKIREDKGRITEITEPLTIRHTYYSTSSGKEDDPANYHNVVWQLAEESNNTNVLITQDNNLSVNERNKAEDMWKSLLKMLKRLVESEKGY